MRSFLEEQKGVRVYLFTTHGHLHIGVVDEVYEDIVQLVAPDGSTRVHVLLADISGVRPFDHAEDG